MSNNNSIWFAVDEDGTEWWFENKPRKSRMMKMWDVEFMGQQCGKMFPGAIQAITGRTLNWADEPIEWKPGNVENKKPKSECKNKVDGSCPLPNIYCKYPDCEN